MSSFEGTTTANRPGSKTEQAKEQAKEKAQEGAQQARRGVRDQVDQRSTQAGERVGSTAQDIRSVSEELRNQGKDQPAKLAEQAAEPGGVARRLSAALRRRHDPARRRGFRPPAAVGRHRRRSGARVRRLALPEGLELAPLRELVVAVHADAQPDRRRADEPHRPRRRRRLARVRSAVRTAGTSRRRRWRTHRAGNGAPCARRARRDDGAPRAMASHDPGDARDRGIGELVKDLASQTSTLVRQEIQLAQAEVTQKGKLAGKGAGMLARRGRHGPARARRADRAADHRARRLPAAVARGPDRDRAVVRRRRRARPWPARRRCRRRRRPSPRPLRP